MNQQQMQALKTQLQQTHSPKQILQNVVSRNRDPIMQQLFSLAEHGDINSLENIARESFKTQGRDFDKEFSEFMNNFKGIN